MEPGNTPTNLGLNAVGTSRSKKGWFRPPLHRQFQGGDDSDVETQGVGSAIKKGIIASNVQVTDSLDNKLETIHRAEPHFAWMTPGIVMLSCSEKGPHSVGLLQPGAPAGSGFSWKHYGAGGCCLCDSQVFLVLWKGLRRTRNGKMHLVQDGAPSGGVELAGPCRVSFCNPCWVKWAPQYRAVRKDRHKKPCTCKLAPWGEISFCDPGRSGLPRVESATLLGYRSPQAHLFGGDWRAWIQDGWNRPIVKKSRRLAPFPTPRTPLTTVGEEMCKLPLVKAGSKTVQVKSQVWEPLTVRPEKVDWITTGTRTYDGKGTLWITRFIGNIEVLVPGSAKANAPCVIVYDVLSREAPTLGDPPADNTLAEAAWACVRGDRYLTSTEMLVSLKGKTQGNGLLGTWWRRDRRHGVARPAVPCAEHRREKCPPWCHYRRTSEPCDLGPGTPAWGGKHVTL